MCWLGAGCFSKRSPASAPALRAEGKIAAGVAVTEALVEMLASRAGKPVIRRIDEAEGQLFESGAYLQAPRLRGA